MGNGTLPLSKPQAKRGGAFISRFSTSLFALVISNFLFYGWEAHFISRFGISLDILAYAAQGIGSCVGTLLDYAGHARVYESLRAHRGSFKELRAFCTLRIFFLPVGLITFVLSYNWQEYSYFTSSCLAIVVGWITSYRFFDALLLKRIRSLPRPLAKASIKALRHLDRVRSK